MLLPNPVNKLNREIMYVCMYVCIDLTVSLWWGIDIFFPHRYIERTTSIKKTYRKFQSSNDVPVKETQPTVYHMFAFMLRKTGSMHEQPGDLWWKSVIAFIRKGSCVYAIAVPLFFWSYALFVPQLSIHILKPYITGIKTTVSVRDSLIYWWVSSVSVNFMIKVKGQGCTDTFLTRSLFG